MFEHGSLHAAGIVIVTDWNGNDVTRDTQQCVHCGGHWIIVRGSKRPHVFCQNCGGNTCSDPKCLRQCYPEEKRHDDMAKHGRLIWSP
jgi:hypothetical protein